MASSSSSSSPEISNAPPASQRSSVQYSNLSREEVLEDLSSRFILNLPEEELASLERVCFQVEQAHWYYEDFIREQNPSRFPSYTLKTFSEALFRACPVLHQWAHDHDRTFQSFMQYKTRVPVCGAIMLNATWDKCVLVKGWKSSAGWGFPKGKINEQEPRHKCAIREVLEETGYDLEGQLEPENVIELSIKEQSISLYIVPGVPEDYPFQTRTRKEISKIAWFNLSDLPTWKRSKAVPGKFYLITPFIGPLRSFLKRKPRHAQRTVHRVQNAHDVLNAHLSSEDEVGHDGLYPRTGQDSHVQESSSQSSSADNGEPQTPSPLYSAAQVNYPSESHELPHKAVMSGLDIGTVDPQLARLLTGLSLSASGVVVQSDDGGKASLSSRTLSPATTQTFKMETAKAHHRPSDSGDWSLHVPPDAQSSSPMTHTIVPSVRPSASRQSPSKHASSPSVSSAGNELVHLGIESNAQPSASLAPSSSTVVLSTQTTGPPQLQSPKASHARKGSTADISPYLSRPRDIPKEMKYISMLEGLAKESDKFANKKGPQPTGFVNQVVAPERIHMAPAPPASVPPPQPNWMDSSVIYSSASPMGPTVPAFAPATRPMPPYNQLPFQDSFGARPQTSTAFRPGSYARPPPPPGVGTDARFPVGNFDLRGYPPVRPSTAGFRQSQQLPPAMGPISQYHIPPNFPPQAHAPPPQGPAFHTGLRVAPPEQFPSSQFGEAPPLSAPALSPRAIGFPPRINPPRPATNAHLLSILNSPNPLPSMATAPSGAPSGAFGVGPR